MSAWDRYGLEAVDDVFRELGALSARPPDDPEAYAWATTKGSVPRIASYAPERGMDGIRADHVEHIARRLGFDTQRVFRMLDERGGKIL